jgi:tetratricopeptide (TPR) repeat protein
MAETKKTEQAVQENVAAVAGAGASGMDGIMNIIKKYQVWLIAGGVLLLGIVAWLLLRGGGGSGNAKKELPLQRDLSIARSYAERDSTNLALTGDTLGNKGLETIISKNKGTVIAEEAKLQAAHAHLTAGNTKKAISYLESVSGFGPSVEARRLSLLGDAWSTQGTAGGTINKSDCEKAIGYYEDAVNKFADDEANAAFYLFKAGQLYELTGNAEKAKTAYLNIKEKYPSSSQANEIEKYLGKLGVEN